MRFNLMQKPRKHLRLPGFNYKSAGFYFVTFCIQGRLCLLGEIMNGESVLNEPGYIVYHEINTLKNRYLGIHVDTFVVMPNHVHAIIVIEPGRTQRSDPTNSSLADVIRNIKTFTTTEYIHGVHTKKWTPFHKRLWQRGYYEQIIRNDMSLSNIRQYIIDNPLKWETDKENPQNTGIHPFSHLEAL